MPIYLYQEILDDGADGEVFEVEQPMSAPALQRHPVTGRAVRRVYVAPHLATQYTPGATQKKLDPKNVERAGFTQYVRDKQTGSYHKTAGRDPRAPAVLKRPPG